MIIKKHKFFDKSYSKLNDKIKGKVKEILMIFENDCFNKKLNNHALKGVFLGFRSINVTGNYRIIFRELSNNTYEIVELINVGTHSELYK